MAIATTATVLAMVMVMATGIEGRSKGGPMPFQKLTRDDSERAGVLGAGCSWSLRKRDRTILGMTDDRAALKRGGRLVILKPAPGAQDLAPFTFDRWEGAGMMVAVRDLGPARAYGTSADQPATLVIEEGGRTRSYRGNLNCGT